MKLFVALMLGILAALYLRRRIHTRTPFQPLPVDPHTAYLIHACAKRERERERA